MGGNFIVMATKVIKKKAIRKSVSKKISQVKTKSRVNSPKKTHTKRINMSRKRSAYSRGIPTQTLSIRYNGVGNEFVFALTNKQGIVGAEFHIKGVNLFETMGIPVMVNSL